MGSSNDARPDIRTIVFDYFWATLVGASSFVFLFALVLTLGGVLHLALKGPFLLGGLYIVAMTLSLSVGFPSPARSVIERLARGIMIAAFFPIEAIILSLPFIGVVAQLDLAPERGALLVSAGGALVL